MEDLYEASNAEIGEELTEEVVAEAEASAPTEEKTPEVDYAALVESDVASLKEEFPELASIRDITELDNPLRYAALRDLGLSPAEAYLATAKRKSQDTRAHLRSAHGRSAGVNATMMSQLELAVARDLFPSLNDAELQRLYKRVTK